MTKILTNTTLLTVLLFISLSCEPTKQKTMIKAIDPANMDLLVKPGDDFFRYVNGTWMANNPIPPEYSMYGAFHQLYDNNQEQLKALVREVSSDQVAEEGSISQKIRDFYNSGMDTLLIEKTGIQAIDETIMVYTDRLAESGMELDWMILFAITNP